MARLTARTAATLVAVQWAAISASWSGCPRQLRRPSAPHARRHRVPLPGQPLEHLQHPLALLRPLPRSASRYRKAMCSERPRPSPWRVSNLAAASARAPSRRTLVPAGRGGPARGPLRGRPTASTVLPRHRHPRRAPARALPFPRTGSAAATGGTPSRPLPEPPAGPMAVGPGISRPGVAPVLGRRGEDLGRRRPRGLHLGRRGPRPCGRRRLYVAHLGVGRGDS